MLKTTAGRAGDTVIEQHMLVCQHDIVTGSLPGQQQHEPAPRCCAQVCGVAEAVWGALLRISTPDLVQGAMHRGAVSVCLLLPAFL